MDLWQSMYLYAPYAQTYFTHARQIVAMQEVTVAFFVDGDSGELSDGTRFRLASAKMPDRSEPRYHTAKRSAQQLVPDGSEVEITVVGADCYRRKLVIMRTMDGKNVNARQIRRFEHR